MGELAPKGLTKAHLINTGIGEDYWDVDWSNYQGSESAMKEAQNYLIYLSEYKPLGTGLVFAGKTGTGKTSLMAVVLKYLVRANWSVRMSSLSELIELIKRSWDDNDLVSSIDFYKHVDFLALDDLGKEHAGPTGFSAVTFDNLLRYRVQHRLPSLFTTNLNRTEIKTRYGDATLSLIEGKCKVIQVKGEDYRTSVQKQALHGTR